MIKVLVVDDEPLVRAGIRTILGSDREIEVVAEAGDGRAAIEYVCRGAVDVALLDIRMPVLDGLTAAQRIAELSPRTAVIILTTFGEDAYITGALGRGAAGFLLKDSAPDELLRAVHAVAQGHAFLTPPVTRRVVDRVGQHDGPRTEQSRQQIAALSEREREVLLLLSAGLSNATIAGKLFMSEATVKTYVSRILGKLGCENRVQAAILALNAGFAKER